MAQVNPLLGPCQLELVSQRVGEMFRSASISSWVMKFSGCQGSLPHLDV